MFPTQDMFTIRDDDEFIVAAYGPEWYFSMGTRDSDDEPEHPFVITGQLRDMLDYVPESEMSEQERTFSILFEAAIVPTQPCQKMLDQIAQSLGSDEPDIREDHRLHWVIEGVLSYGGAVPCTSDILTSKRDGVDPFEGLVEGEHYVLTQNTVGFRDWDTACLWVRTHLTNVAQVVGHLIGFTMDRPVNRIGTSGWDWVRPVVTGEEAFVI